MKHYNSLAIKQKHVTKQVNKQAKLYMKIEFFVP